MPKSNKNAVVGPVARKRADEFHSKSVSAVYGAANAPGWGVRVAPREIAPATQTAHGPFTPDRRAEAYALPSDRRLPVSVRTQGFPPLRTDSSAWNGRVAD